MTTTFINVIGRALAGNLQAVAILSHVLMLAFYMILFALYFCHIPIGSPFDEKRQVTVDTWLTVALQCFGVVCTIILLTKFETHVLVRQRLKQLSCYSLSSNLL